MANLLMLMSSILFGVLFTFLLFVFAIFLFSMMLKHKKKYIFPKISVLVPTYNEEKNIRETLDAVEAADYPKKRIEIIVIDDGSTDATVKIVQGMIKKGNRQKTIGLTRKGTRIMLLRQKHRGKVEALNYGSKISRNEYLVAIDADTVIGPETLKELLQPFSDKTVGATTGNNHVKNKKSIISRFQNIEYHYTNLIRASFSKVFRNGIWFSGSLACYRKSALRKIGYFKKDTLAEDQDVALELRKNGYRTVNTPNAYGFTVVPDTFRDFYKQRSRWWIGTLQAILKNRSLLHWKSSPSILFLYISQFWWSFYAFLSLPLIMYQVSYWLPYNSQNFFSVFIYLFRWFSLLGPIYVLTNIPVNGISIYSIFGVLAGVITTTMCILAVRIFKDRINFWNLVAIFFYFPFTIVLNTIILTSLITHRFWEKSFYLK